MIMLQLNPPLPFLTPKGPALAHIQLDYGAEHHLMWVCIQDKTGEVWTWPNPDVRGTANQTMGRPSVQPPRLEKNDTNSTDNLDGECAVSGADISAQIIGRIWADAIYRYAGRNLSGGSPSKTDRNPVHKGPEGDGLHRGGKTVR